ncbi:hypothetical protein PUNSTDRAFT_145555 [Punctularia strigosozonata HHB-11173 SS5]|uniref:uncharacterized protein n=1 Tax=Punctularia strigosozonata (strain HHB-11173) TaxID=741275 RepID=UPI000441731B|nr:uncharacterized protein PUNSTDRAFT_145555 [Punctularia strigosozonata HHB-11173 SS5]EIN06263.1 hypothetical protein PUNSTDRAFT_145555 [Punctularia strigosozonata HHB-11173 SS5]
MDLPGRNIADRIPPEIMLRILTIYHDAIAPVQRLLYVCKSFKALIEDHSRFWNRLYILEPIPEDLPHLERILQLSRSQPLYVTLVLPGNDAYEDTEPPEADSAAAADLCIRRLRDQQHRLASLGVFAFRDGDIRAVARALEGAQLPVLHELWLADVVDQHTSENLHRLAKLPEPPVFIFDRAAPPPLLSVVRIEQRIARYAVAPMRGLTALHLGTPAGSRCDELLDMLQIATQGSPGLQCLGLGLCGVMLPLSQTLREPQSLPFPALLYLHLEGGSETIAWIVLWTLSAPALKALHVMDHFFDPMELEHEEFLEWPQDPAETFTQRFGPGGILPSPYASVQSLTLRNVGWLSLLPVLPNLRHLTLCWVHYVFSMVEYLGEPPEKAPELEVLTFEGDLINDEGRRLFLDVVRRKARKGRLRRVRMFHLQEDGIGNRHPEEFMQSLRELVEVSYVNPHPRDFNMDGEALAHLYASATEVDDWEWHMAERSW